MFGFERLALLFELAAPSGLCLDEPGVALFDLLFARVELRLQVGVLLALLTVLDGEAIDRHAQVEGLLLELQELVLGVSLLALEGQTDVPGIEQVLFLLRHLVAQGEDLLVLFVERLAQVEELPARDGATAGGGGRGARLELLDLMLQALDFGRGSGTGLDLSLEATRLRAGGAQLLLELDHLVAVAIELLAQTVELLGVDLGQRRDRGGANLCGFLGLGRLRGRFRGRGVHERSLLHRGRWLRSVQQPIERSIGELVDVEVSDFHLARRSRRRAPCVLDRRCGHGWRRRAER